MSDISKEIKLIELEFLDSLEKAKEKSADSKSAEEIKTYYSDVEQQYLGKNSKLLKLLKSLKNIKNSDEKKLVGSSTNILKTDINSKVADAYTKSIRQFQESLLKKEYVDPTRPGIKPEKAINQHIVTSTIAKIEDIFTNMGFEVEYSYEVDTAYNSFDTVNIPENHPARDNWDTLWLSDGNLAIPHTSAMQNRVLKSNEVPIRKIVIGKCFRNEATDATHEHTFYQVEGIYLDKQASMANMLGVMVEFIESYFQKKVNYKFTPDFFPFVEPGGQLAIEWQKGKYLEILGCGMIHPKVIEMAGKSADDYSGFAWGFGLERLILLSEKIEDIRLFYSGDYRFIKQFN